MYCLGFSPSLFTLPQFFLFSPPLHPSTCPSPLNTFIPLSEKKFRGRKCGEEWAGMEGRELNEVGVMDGVTMKSWAVGRNERQMDGEKEHVH